jgi:Tat protein translocase TatC
VLAAPLVAHLPHGSTLIATNVISPFLVPLKITLMAGFMLALPVVLYQVWAFVAPGLYTHEKKLVLPLVISSTLLFFAGVAFCYFFVFGRVFTFIQAFAPKTVSAMPDIEAYLSFVLTMFVAFGSAFEVPIVVVVLARIGLVSIEKLSQLLHRPGLHHCRDPDAARRRLAAGPRDSDGAALRGGYLGGADLHQAHAGAGGRDNRAVNDRAVAPGGKVSARWASAARAVVARRSP